MISAVSTLGLLDKNPIIEKILMSLEQDFENEEMTFEVFLEEITNRLVNLFFTLFKTQGHPSHEEGRKTLFGLIDE